METAWTSTPSYGFLQFVRNLLIKLDKICQPTRTFLSDEERYSNTIELYDAVPKYFSNHKIMASMREGGKYLPVLKREFAHKGDTYILHIRPARLLYPNGAEMEHYPSPPFWGRFFA
jgi:hypothetical protein